MVTCPPPSSRPYDDWTGTVSLTSTTYPPFGTTWRDGLRSMWVSNTFTARMSQTSGPVTSIEDYAPWRQVNLGAGYTSIQHF